MKVKIYKHISIIPNVDDDIIKFKDYFAKHGVILDLSVEKTTIPKDQVGLKIFSPNDGKYDVVIYMYDRNTYQMNSAGLAMTFSKTLQGIYLSITKSDDAVDYTWKCLCHEMMHTFFNRLNFERQRVSDPMDSMMVNGVWQYYYKNEDLSAPDGNFAEAWKRLRPYLPQTFTLTRTKDDGVQTLGNFTNQYFFCQTLERTWNNNLPNISCIPKGTYICKYTFSPKFLKYTYELQNVKGRSGIRIHSGNYFFDIQGCILLGDSYSDINKDGKVDVLNSRATIKTLEDLLEKEPFTLIIS
jgi:hypothetical protein